MSVIESGHPEATCERCGRDNTRWFVDSDRWNAATEGGPERDRWTRGAVLCPVCFVDLHEQAVGLQASWTLTPATPFRPIETEVSNRGGDRPPLSETTRPGPQRGETRPATSSDDRGGRGAGTRRTSSSDTGTTPSRERTAATPTTNFERLHEIAAASLAAAERFGAGWYDAPDLVAALDAMVGSPDSEADAAHIVAFDPLTVLALLDAAAAADGFVGDGRLVGGRLKAAVVRLREVTS